MVSKRGTKSVKASRKIRNLRLKSLGKDQTKNVEGGVRVAPPPRRGGALEWDIKKKSEAVDPGFWG